MFTPEKNQINYAQQRRDPRIKFPLSIKIDGQTYIASDWSKGGFKVKYFDSNSQVGDCLPVSLVLNLRGGIKFSLDVLSEVVWRSKEKKKAGFRFLNLREHEKQLLNNIIQDIQTGELTAEQVDFDSDQAKNVEAFRELERKHEPQHKGWQFWVKTTLLALFGLTALSVTGIALYRAVAFIHIDSATIAQSLEEINSTHRGQLSYLYVKEGATIEAGGPLLRVYDEQMAQFVAEDEARNLQQMIRDYKNDLEWSRRELKLTQTELENAQVQLQIARSRQQEEVQQLEVSRQVTSKQLAQAQARVESLETQYETAQKSLERVQFLSREGATTEERVDRARDHLADVEGELKVARKAVEIKKDVLATIDQGSFYNGERFNGNLPELKAKVAEAKAVIAQTSQEISIYQQEIQEKEQKIITLEQQYHNQDFQLPIAKFSDTETENIFSQVYNSPINGTVVQIKEAAGEPIQIGETLLVLQPHSDAPVVDAFFTQDQAARLSIGQEATVTVTNVNRRYEAKVVKIDRSGGLRDEIQGRYQFEGSTNRPAYVQLKLLNVTAEEQKTLTPGTRLDVTIRKENWF